MIKDSIAILCRGESLQHLEELPDVEEYLIINGFSDELEIDFIKERLTGKKITHILSLGSLAHPHPSGARHGCFGAMLVKDHFKKFNIEGFVLPYVTECLPGDFNNPVVHNVKNSKNENIPVYCLGDDNKEFMMKDNPRYKFTYPSCGMAAVGVATVDLGKKNVYIIGMDFYDGRGYFKRGVYKSQEAAIKRSAREGKMMRDFFPGFIEKLSDVNFNMYTLSKIDSTATNLKVYNYES